MAVNTRQVSLSRNVSGFTLIEMMITLLLSAVIMAVIYSAYLAQQKSQINQDAVAEMQQNLRASMLYMTHDIRGAGCDPTGLANARIITASPGVFRFTRDIGGTPGQPNRANGVIDHSAGQSEEVTYGFSVNRFDFDSDGIADGGVALANWSAPGELGRDPNTVGNPAFNSIADFISAIEFNYILEDNSTPPVTTTTTTPTNAELNSIVGVQVSILARAPRPDPEYSSITNYTTGAGTNWGPFNDNFRRRLNITTIQCRNLAMD